jgi:hypothetical protein
VYYLGWLSLAGGEVWNIQRTLAYVRANVPSLDMSGCDECDTLALALGDPPYKNNPVDDNAPWIAEDEPDLNDFYGFYPMSMEGLYDHTLTATVTQMSGDGGFVSSPRHETKDIRVTGVLLARTRIALVKGRAWLNNALSGSRCLDSGPGCNGDDMCFFATCPTDVDQGDYYLRTVRDVSLIEGPNVTQTYGELPSGAWMDLMEFNIVAATPFIYGPMDYLGSTVGTTTQDPEPDPEPDPEQFTASLTIDTTPPRLPECPYYPPQSITDPEGPQLPQPPRPPNVTNSLQPPAPYGSGYSVFIPASRVPEALDAVLIITLTTAAEAARWVRLRLYAAPIGYDQKLADLDPCSFCGDITITYIPPNSKFVIDGMSQVVYIQDTAGNKYPASHLVFSGTGQPAQWAAVTCGMDYWLSVEFTGTTQPVNLFTVGPTLPSSSFIADLGSWTNGVNDGSPRAVLARDTAQSASPPASMRVNWPAGSTDRPQVVINGLRDGRLYVLSMWVKSPTARVSLGVDNSARAQSVPGPDWQHVEVNVWANSTTVTAYLSRDTTQASGDIWVDDFGLRDSLTGTYAVVELELATARKE